MGFMTELCILNDDWNRISKDPQRLVDQINNEMHGDRDSEGFQHVEVLQSHHADDMHVTVAHQNTFTDFSIPRKDMWGEDLTPIRKKTAIEYKLQLMETARSYMNYEESALKNELDRVNTLIDNGVQ